MAQLFSLGSIERRSENNVIYKMKTPALLISGCLIALAAFTSNSHAAQLVEMRLVLDKPSDGAEQMTLDKETLYVQKKALLDQTDLRSVAVSTNMPVAAPQVGLVFLFTDKGTQHLSEVSRQNEGKRLAVVVDGQIVSAPAIQQISDGVFEFHGSFTEQRACDIAVKVDKVLQR